MNVTATLDGESVTVVDVNANGQMIYVTYVDSSSVLKISKRFLDSTGLATTLATSATAS